MSRPSSSISRGEVMFTNRLALLAYTYVLFFFTTGTVQAGLVSIEPADSEVAVGELFSLMTLMDFEDTTVGGGMTLTLNSSDGGEIEFLSFNLDPLGDLGDDPDFRCPGGPLACPADPHFLSFGSFAGITGQHTVAELVFEALSPGVVDVSFDITSPFADTLGGALDVTIIGASVTVVPEPGTLSMLALGLLSLVRTGYRRRCGGRA